VTFSHVWRDVVLAVVLSVSLGFMSWRGAAAIGPGVLAYNDVWFEADSLRVYLNMSSRWSDQRRMTVHPLFSLLVFPFVKALRLLGVESPLAVRTVISAVAAIWAASLYGVLRLIHCRRGDAVLFSLLGGLSAASLVWFAVPETYAFGSLSVIWALALVALSERRLVSESSYVAVSAFTLSFTITNWMAGIAAAATCLPWRRAAQVSVNALFLVILLWTLQYHVFPNVPFFLTDQRDESHFVLPAEVGGPGAVVRAFIFHAMVMPAVQVSYAREPFPRPRLNTQHSALGSGGWSGLLATGLWSALLGVGMWAAANMRALRSVRVALVCILLGQLALHTLYGGETFLYSLHWLPLLVVLAALGTLTRQRVLARILGVGLLVTAAINNCGLFLGAASVVRLHPMTYPESVSLTRPYVARSGGENLRWEVVPFAPDRGGELL
jgi:hypothetical protein